MWYDSIVSLQGAEISVYERDVCKQVVEEDGVSNSALGLSYGHGILTIYENKLL